MTANPPVDYRAAEMLSLPLPPMALQFVYKQAGSAGTMWCPPEVGSLASLFRMAPKNRSYWDPLHLTRG